MSKMKNSGLNWIGNIPDEWNISTMKYDCTKITDYTASGSFASLAENVEYLDSPDYAMLVRVADLSNRRDIPPIYINEHSYNFLRNSNLKGGELILSNIGSVGDVFFYEPLYKKSSLAPNAILAISKYLTKYLYYYFLCPTVSNELKEIGGNAVQSKFNKTQLRAFKCLQPKRQEQKLIVDFLDEKIDIIDKIIGDLNNQIEILNKYKKQIITETVTSGLNKNAKFKDSGIDWMGEIPEHWEIKRLKYLGSARNGLTYEPEDQCDEGMLVLRSSNIQDGKLCLDDNVYVNMKVPKNIILKRNDLLICSRNGSRNLIGKNILIEDSIEGNTYGAFMCVFRSEYNKYIHYVLNSNIFDHYLNTFLTSTINQLTNSNLYSIKIAIPMDIKEQQEIVKYLDDRCQKIDEILNSKIKQKKQMEQYKKSVIYEYVTGKKRVEGAEELYG